jgi:hypothetical protein
MVGMDYKWQCVRYPFRVILVIDQEHWFVP